MIILIFGILLTASAFVLSFTDYSNNHLDMFFAESTVIISLAIYLAMIKYNFYQSMCKSPTIFVMR